nr:cupin domain-containing protein [Thermotoga sp.]
MKAGDVCFTDSGESHSIENTGDENLEFLAVIILL